MKFEEYWAMVLIKYPTFKNEENKIKMSVSSLKALMEQSHEKGKEEKEVPVLNNPIFEQIFGKGKRK